MCRDSSRRSLRAICAARRRQSSTRIFSARSCSRVCPVAVLCEGACVMHRYNEQPIQIGRLQRHAMDYFYEGGASLPMKTTRATRRKDRMHRRRPGFARLCSRAAAARISVTVFDKQPLPGGLNTYGVAEYKLRRADSLREIELIRSLGVEFEVRDIATVRRPRTAGAGVRHYLSGRRVWARCASSAFPATTTRR